MAASRTKVTMSVLHKDFLISPRLCLAVAVTPALILLAMLVRLSRPGSWHAGTRPDDVASLPSGEVPDSSTSLPRHNKAALDTFMTAGSKEQIQFAIWTNTFCNLYRIQFATWTNTFCNLDKYNLHVELGCQEEKPTLAWQQQ